MVDSIGSLRAGSKVTNHQWLSGLRPEINSARSFLASADRLLLRYRGLQG